MAEERGSLNDALLDGAAPKEAAHPRRWVAVGLTACGSAMNAFQFMNFSPIADLSTGVFSATTGQVSWLYSASLLSVLPAFFLAVRWTSAPATQRGALRAMHGLNLAAALLRAGSAYVGSYALAMASSVLLGVAASFVISAFTSVSQRWLPAAERPLGVSLTVQANYFGWLLGAVLVPYACVAKSGLVRLLEVQAAAAGLLFVLAAFGAPEPPADGGAVAAEVAAADLDVAPPSPKFGLTTAVRELAARPRWLASCAAYALAGGVGFAVPAAQDIVFDEACAFSPKVTALANAAFIAAGVVTGLALGFAHDAVERREAGCLLGLLGLGVAAIRGLAGAVLPTGLVPACDEYACVGLMAAAGASTIGFVGLALGEAGKSAGPNPAARVFSGGCVEWWLQVCGAAITQVASNRRGFETCAAFQGAALAAGAVALLGLRRD